VHDERGTATLWVLGLCVSLLILGGLGIDFWRAIAERRELSARADAAATAAVNGLDEDALRAGVVRVVPDQARAIAVAQLAVDPEPPDETHIAVDGNTVTVTIRDHVDFSLLGIFMPGDRFEIKVHARAAPDERP
jgi:Flp pilus assembly protein TadG